VIVTGANLTFSFCCFQYYIFTHFFPFFSLLQSSSSSSEEDFPDDEFVEEKTWLKKGAEEDDDDDDDEVSRSSTSIHKQKSYIFLQNEDSGELLAFEKDAQRSHKKHKKETKEAEEEMKLNIAQRETFVLPSGQEIEKEGGFIIIVIHHCHYSHPSSKSPQIISYLIFSIFE